MEVFLLNMMYFEDILILEEISPKTSGNELVVWTTLFVTILDLE